MSRGVVALLVAIAFLAGALWFYPWQPKTYWHIPDGYPEPPVPADNPLNDAKIELGRLLFYDTRLSINGSTSCGTCHQQQLAFTDGRARSVGATGELHPRGSMSLVNVAYASRLTWANQMLDSLEVQALTPMFGENPVEMGLAGREREMVRMLSADANYRSLFASAFPGVDDRVYSRSEIQDVRVASATRSSTLSQVDITIRGDVLILIAHIPKQDAERLAADVRRWLEQDRARDERQG